MTEPNTPQDAAAALQPQSADTSQDNSQTPPEGGGDDGSFFIPADVLGGKKYKAGDTITLSVKGEDGVGDLEVTMAGAGDEGGGDWRNELKSKLAEAGTETGGSNG